MNKLLEIIEKEGWSVIDEGENYLISQFSPAGEDYGFSISKGTNEEMAESIIYYDFDEDEHATMWIDNKSVSGVPQSIRALIDDADAIKEMHEELAEKVKEHYTI